MKLKYNEIGIRGAAGSGKDTVSYLFGGVLNYFIEHDGNMACFDTTDFARMWQTMKENALKANGNVLKTEGTGDFDNIYFRTFADNVKLILSLFTNIELDMFYDAKAKEDYFFNPYSFTHCWRNELPQSAIIVKDNELYTFVRENNVDLSAPGNEKYWISIRSLMIYFGTYIIQTFFGRKAWVNTLARDIKNADYERTVSIFTDCRFPHEVDFIRASNGLMFKIVSTRGTIKEYNSIAETSLNDNDDVDVVIDNSGELNSLLPQFFEILNKYFQ